MKRAVLGSALFLVIAPGTVAGMIPRWIRHSTTDNVAARVCGALLVVAGSFVLLDSFWRFASEGLGTPAPVAPTKTLVVTGFYWYVRNPMYVAVLGLIFGQGLMWADIGVLGYGCAVWVAFHFFVTLYEEPRLRRTFGQQYLKYCGKVPRWIPIR